ncbi:MAG: M48 family metallopeptidase [Nitrospirae bacterium]|nr:M48 family metallopeptidase [Nitrospirota bacterium]MBI3352895.1 M48 family metallopeptidase [Nitrospirota bacterium]
MHEIVGTFSCQRASPRPAFRTGRASCFIFILWAVPGFLLSSCSSAPVSGRSQFILPNFDSKTETQMGLKAYQEVVSKGPLSKDPKILEMVNRVGRKIADVVEDRVKAKKIGLSDAPHYQWEFTVIDDPKTINAFALPGGKVAIYTGILPLTRDEAGLATVLGHEIGHAIARHGVERMSTGVLAEIGAAGLEALLGGGGNPQQEAVLHQAFGIGTSVGVMLPFERSQESEADQIGLNLMAMAGYNPQEAIGFWERMAAESKNQTPEFLSTHPTDKKRIEEIKRWLPEAMKLYHP